MKKEKVTEKPAAEETTKAPATVSVEEPNEVKKEKPAKVTKVGAMLKEMRLQKGLKIADISKKLCIRKFYLEAIEDSNYKEVPAFPYGIGFIRSYANFLGLNGENIVELYKEETNTAEPKDIRVLEPQPEATMPGIQYLLISLLAIIVIYAVWTMFNQSNGDVSEEQPAAEISSVADNNDSGVVVVEEFNFEPPSEVENTTDDTVSTPAPAADEPQIVVSEEKYKDQTPKNDKPAVDVKKAEETKNAERAARPAIPAQGVFIEVLKETWVEVKDETKLYISKVLQAGDTYTVPEGRGMILSVGKYDGVNVYINGTLTKVTRLGKKTNIALDQYLSAER